MLNRRAFGHSDDIRRSGGEGYIYTIASPISAARPASRGFRPFVHEKGRHAHGFDAAKKW